MEKKDKKYKRLPGKKRKTFGSDTLWEGPDHLLLIESSGMSETYRRFYYKDIKSILIAKTKENFYKTFLVLGLFLGFTVLGLVFWIDDQNPASVFFFIFSPIFLFYFLVCLAGGPSCACWIVTAVRKEKLSPSNRLRPTLKMMARLKPCIEAVQGQLDRENLNLLFENGQNSVSPMTRSNLGETPPSFEKGSWHKALFMLLILVGILSIFSLFNRSYFTLIIGTLLFFGFCITAVVALVRQTGSSLSSVIKNLTWASLGLVILGFIQSYMEMIYLMFEKGDQKQPLMNQMTLLKMHAQMNPFDHPVFLTLDLFQTVICFVLGIWGLVLIRRRFQS
ncbi:MAG: hypothetical protein KKD44_19705 [Proteobacteria bacterium]|nr:hypothetical protein [Pseudomonadota bacterium]